MGAWGFVQTIPGSVGLVPSGAVVAFAEKCPDVGWTRYWPATSRTIVGAAEQAELGSVPSEFGRADNDIPLSARPLASVTGEEQHVLTVPELAPHSHEYESEVGVDGNRSGRQDATFNRTTRNTTVVGEGKPFTNMQPSIALYYCLKTK